MATCFLIEINNTPTIAVKDTKVRAESMRDKIVRDMQRAIGTNNPSVLCVTIKEIPLVEQELIENASDSV